MESLTSIKNTYYLSNGTCKSSANLYSWPYLPDKRWTLAVVVMPAVHYLLLCLSVFPVGRCDQSRPSQGRGECSVGNTHVRYQRSPRVTCSTIRKVRCVLSPKLHVKKSIHTHTFVHTYGWWKNKGSQIQTERTRCLNNVKKFCFPSRSTGNWNEMDVEVMQGRNIHDFKTKFDKSSYGGRTT